MDDFMDFVNHFETLDPLYFETDGLRYEVKYAKSGQSKCQLCRQFIANATISLGIVDASSIHDGTIPRWYHFQCFFLKQGPSTTNDIACFDEIRSEDQIAIKEKLEQTHNALPPAKRRKRTKGGGGSSNGSGDFKVEYAKSSKSTCRGCEEKIIKGETRISKEYYDNRRYGGFDGWHHVECFVKLRAELGYYGSGYELPGAAKLSKKDRASLKALLPKMSQDDMPPPPKKIKDGPEDVEEAEFMKKQIEELSAISSAMIQIMGGITYLEAEVGSALQLVVTNWRQCPWKNVQNFESLYEEKMGNQWENREHFVKIPNLMYLIDVDHEDQKVASLDSNIKSNLEIPIQDLMRFIFDVAEMNFQ